MRETMRGKLQKMYEEKKKTKMNGRQEGLEVIHLLRVTRLTWLGVRLPSIYQNHLARECALWNHMSQP